MRKKIILASVCYLGSFVMLTLLLLNIYFPLSQEDEGGGSVSLPPPGLSDSFEEEPEPESEPEPEPEPDITETEINYEELAKLEAVIEKYSGVSVYYKDLKSGEEYFYNPEQKYIVASIIKAPYKVYVYRQIMAGNGDLDEIFTYRASDIRAGTGKIKDMAVGTRFTLGELMSYSIRWSDNVAMDIIRRRFPVAGFAEFAAEIGVPEECINEIRSAVNAMVCAVCTAAYIRAINDFIEEDNLYSEIFKEHMLNTSNPMIRARYPIARKYGWAVDSFHDIGVVYNPERPYLIAILCSNGHGNFPMFTEISRAAENYNDSKNYQNYQEQ